MEEIYKEKKYYNLTIKYKWYRRKAYICDIDVDCIEGELLAIPEKIDGKEICGIYLDAFSKLQGFLKYKNISIIIPESVNEIYPINYRDGDFPNCIDYFYFATKKYNECESLYNESNVIRNVNINVSMRSSTYSISRENVENLFDTFSSLHNGESKMAKEQFIKIPSKFIIYYGWKKPQNGIWEIDGRLFSYQARKKYEEFTCDEVMEYAFNNCNIKKIAFKGEITTLHKNAIYNCRQLEQIDIDSKFADCKFHSICKCKNLAKLRLPKDAYKKDIVHMCYKNMIVDDINNG